MWNVFLNLGEFKSQWHGFESHRGNIGRHSILAQAVLTPGSNLRSTGAFPKRLSSIPSDYSPLDGEWTTQFRFSLACLKLVVRFDSIMATITNSYDVQLEMVLFELANFTSTATTAFLVWRFLCKRWMGSTPECCPCILAADTGANGCSTSALRQDSLSQNSATHQDAPRGQFKGTGFCTKVSFLKNASCFLWRKIVWQCS